MILKKNDQLFQEGGPHHIETSPLICRANEWTGYCMIGASVMKELTVSWCIVSYHIEIIKYLAFV